jgi:hypothetical protein
MTRVGQERYRKLLSDIIEDYAVEMNPFKEKRRE